MPRRPNNDKLLLAEELGRLLPRARRLVWYSAEERLAELGLSMFSWQILARLERRGSLIQTELARLTAQHPAGVCRTLEELEARGLIRRDRDTEDRRCVRVDITLDGTALWRRTYPVVVGAVDTALAPLSLAERRLLRNLLRRLPVGLEDDPVPAVLDPARCGKRS